MVGGRQFQVWRLAAGEWAHLWGSRLRGQSFAEPLPGQARILLQGSKFQQLNQNAFAIS
jgi:hypothetical protein